MKRETERKKPRRRSPDPFLRRGFTPGESGDSGPSQERDREPRRAGGGREGASGGGRMFCVSAETPQCRTAGSRELGRCSGPRAATSQWPRRAAGEAGRGEPLRGLPSPPPLSVGYFRCLHRGPKRRSRAPSVPVSGSSLHGQRAPGAPRQPPPPPPPLFCNWKPQPLPGGATLSSRE